MTTIAAMTASSQTLATTFDIEMTIRVGRGSCPFKVVNSFLRSGR